MSTTDLAFIRAYGETVAAAPGGSAAGRTIHVGLGSVVPAPHADFVGNEHASAHAATIDTVQSPSVSVKRPLSSFGGILAPALSQRGAEARSDQQRPALEIESIRWPAVCQSLVATHCELFDQLADELRCESSEGNRVIAISGTERGEGRTTLALCLAQRLARLNTKVLLVDADFSQPAVASQLCIDLNQGWESMLAGEQSPWDVMIDSVADKLSLLLLSGAVAEEQIAGSGYRIAATFSEMVQHYDVVLVDAGPIAPDDAINRWLLESSVEINAIILAHNARSGKAPRLAAGCLQIAQAGRRQLGIAEIFV